VLAGALCSIGKLRHTPAGVPVLEFGLEHESEVVEAGAARKVNVAVEAIAFEGEARLVAGAALGSRLRVQGFLGAKSRRSRKVVLHATRIEFVERA